MSTYCDFTCILVESSQNFCFDWFPILGVCVRALDVSLTFTVLSYDD